MRNNRILLTATSLIEVLLYISLLSFLITSVGTVANDVISAKNKQHSIIETETEVLVLLETIKRDIRNTSVVNSPSAGSSGSSLSLLVREDSGDVNKVYSLQNSNINLKIDSANALSLNSNNILVNNLEFINVQNSSNNMINISFDISYSNPSGRKDLDYSRSVHTSIILTPN